MCVCRPPQQPTQTNLGFEAFNGDELYQADGSGVLWSYRPENSVGGVEDSFQQDLEPEYVAITEDASMAYVILQENNAVAFVSLGDTPKASPPCEDRLPLRCVAVSTRWFNFAASAHRWRASRPWA